MSQRMKTQRDHYSLQSTSVYWCLQCWACWDKKRATKLTCSQWLNATLGVWCTKSRLSNVSTYSDPVFSRSQVAVKKKTFCRKGGGGYKRQIYGAQCPISDYSNMYSCLADRATRNLRQNTHTPHKAINTYTVNNLLWMEVRDLDWRNWGQSVFKWWPETTWIYHTCCCERR